MLFELVDKELLSLDQAAEIAEMDFGEALDMLNGWEIAHKQ